MFTSPVRGSVTSFSPDEDFLSDDSFFDSMAKTSAVAFSGLRFEAANQSPRTLPKSQGIFDDFDSEEFVKHVKSPFSNQRPQEDSWDDDELPVRIRARL